MTEKAIGKRQATMFGDLLLLHIALGEFASESIPAAGHQRTPAYVSRATAPYEPGSKVWELIPQL